MAWTAEYRREYMRKWGKKNRDKQKASHDKYRSKPEIKAHLAAKMRIKNATQEGKDRARARCLKFHYGLTVAQYDKMAAAQYYCCAICHAEAWTEQYGKLAVDHDHATGAIRELLCSTCNHALGALKDSPALANAAAAYLRKHS